MATTVAISGISMIGRLTATVTKSIDDGTQQIDSADKSVFSNLNPDDATKFFHNRFTVSGSGQQDFDLDALTNQVGESTQFATVYGFYIRNRSTTTGHVLRVGNSDFATWLGSATDYVVLGPKGCLFLCGNVDGYAVTASTGDVLTIANPGTVDIDIDIAIIGK